MKQTFSEILGNTTAIGAVFACAVALTGSGCSTLHAELPTHRFESPEVNGTRHRFGLQGSVSAAHNLTITPDASRRPPDFSSPSLDDDRLVGLGASFGLIEKIDLAVKGTFGPSPTLFQVKYQFFGSTHREAKQGDTSLAITGAIGGGKNSKAGDQSGVFGPGGHNWTGSVEEKTTDVAVIAGTRLADAVLVYAGAFYSNYDIRSTIDQEESDDHLSPAASYSAETGGYQKGVNGGFEFQGGPMMAQLELVYSDMHAANLSHSILQVGVSAGFNF